MNLPWWPDTILLILVVAVLLGGLWALRRATAKRRKTGLPTGPVVYSDTGDWRAPQAPLYSATYGLTGKPDYLVQTADGLIPVEVKAGSSPVKPYSSHVLQLAAYCLLVEDTQGIPVPYGLIVYANRTFPVEFTRELRRTLLGTLRAMRADMENMGDGAVSRSHADCARCRHCGLRQDCGQSLS